MIRRSWVSGASIEATLDLWSASLREVKRRMRPLFAQGRSAVNASLYLDGLLGDERRKTGWMRAEAAGDPGPWRQQGLFDLCESVLRQRLSSTAATNRSPSANVY